MAILTELRDPRVSDVTVTFVEVSADLRQAKIHASIMGDEAKQKLALRGLRNAAGFLQQKVASRIETRYTPKLRFVLDHGVKHSIEVARILDEVLPRDGTREPERPDDPRTADVDTPAANGQDDSNDAPPDDAVGPSPEGI